MTMMPPTNSSGSNIFASGYSAGPHPGVSTDPDQQVAPGAVYVRANNALFLGLLGLIPVFGVLAGIPAVVMGRHALQFLSTSDDSGDPRRGRRVAQVAIGLGVVSIVEALVVLTYIYL